MLMAMIDGIQNRVDPGAPLDRDIYEMTRDEMKHMGVRTTPGSLEEAITALEQDNGFLLKGDVFTTDLIETWVTWKRDRELDPMRMRPHPHEFYLYYDN
jgi:glutamine synthetase